MNTTLMLVPCLICGQANSGEPVSPVAPQPPAILDISPEDRASHSVLVKPTPAEPPGRLGFVAPAAPFGPVDSPVISPLDASVPLEADVRTVDDIGSLRDRSSETTSASQVGMTELSRGLFRELVNDSAQVAGKPITLLQALVHSSQPEQRRSVVQAYWEAVALVADYVTARRYRDALAGIPSAQRSWEQVLLNLSLAEAEAELQQSGRDVVVAQFRLAEATGMTIDQTAPQQGLDTLPFPTDQPLVGGYRTKFEAMFSGRSVPYEAYQLNSTLPLQRKVIASRAVSVLAAQEAVTELGAAYAEGEIAMSRLLSVHARLRDERWRFVSDVRRYNFDIADYALASVDRVLSSDRFVSTLIRSPSSGAVTSNGGIQRASASQGLDPLNNRPLLRAVPTDQGQIPLRPIPPGEDFLNSTDRRAEQ